MFDSLATTHLISLFFGLYFLSAGIGMLLDRKAVPAIFKTIMENPAIGYLTGVIAFLTGAVVISIHSYGSGALSIFISLLGWMALVEGMLLLAFRKQFIGSFSFMIRSEKVILGFAVMAILMGIVFTGAGLQAL